MSTWEDPAVQRATRFGRYMFAWLAILGASLAFVVYALVFSLPDGMRASRSVLIWTGIGLLIGRMTTWRLAWIAPVLSLFPLTYFQRDNVGHPRWWDWPELPAGASGPWLIMLFVVAAGVAALHTTAWQLHALRLLFRQSVTAPRDKRSREQRAAASTGVKSTTQVKQ